MSIGIMVHYSFSQLGVEELGTLAVGSRSSGGTVPQIISASPQSRLRRKWLVVVRNRRSKDILAYSNDPSL